MNSKLKGLPLVGNWNEGAAFTNLYEAVCLRLRVVVYSHRDTENTKWGFKFYSNISKIIWAAVGPDNNTPVQGTCYFFGFLKTFVQLITLFESSQRISSKIWNTC